MQPESYNYYHKQTNIFFDMALEALHFSHAQNLLACLRKPDWR